MKILLDTNGPWLATGYGTQTALFAPRFQAAGHQVAISAMAGIIGQVTEWEGIPCLPGGMARYGNDVRRAHAEQFFQGSPGLVLVLYDAWVLDPRSVHGLAAAVWSPVHSHPMSAGDRQFYARTGAQPIAMSRYGEREMRDAGLQPVYVPHGVDTSVFKPLSDDRRREVRESLGVSEDAFLIAIVAANKGLTPPRKAWAEQFHAFAQFKKRHPDAVLYCHTQIGGPEALDLQPILSNLGLGDDVLFSGQYQQLTGLYPPRFVADLMGAADVLSNPSYGEGFGLAALEAQACGTPVVVADNSAQTELCGSGWLVECQPFWQIGDEAWWHVPSIKGIVAAWEKAYKHARKPEMRARARDFATAYDADLVLTQYWKPALEMLEQYCGAAPVRSPSRNHCNIPLPTAEADGLKWIQRGGHTDDWIAVSHEDSLAPVLDGMLPDGGVFLDVGAHVGRWSLRLARKASQVISVEANPDTAAALHAHIELNGVTNVDVLEMAAWDTETRMTLDDPNQRVNGGSTRVVPGDGAVGARPLDAVLGDVSPDLIKLDVEGADLHALRGMRETLARCRPKLFIEDHSVYGYYELADLEALLTELGYRHQRTWFPLPHGARAPYVIAEPEDGNGQEDHA